MSTKRQSAAFLDCAQVSIPVAYFVKVKVLRTSWALESGPTRKLVILFQPIGGVSKTIRLFGLQVAHDAGVRMVSVAGRLATVVFFVELVDAGS